MATVTNAQVDALRDTIIADWEDPEATIDRLVDRILNALDVHVDYGESGAGQTSPESSESRQTDRGRIRDALRFYHERVTWGSGDDTEREEYRRLVREFS